MKRRVLLCLLFLMCLLIIFPTMKAFGETYKEPSIEISPSESLFNLTNMKPGDWAPRSMTIKNNGEAEFQFDINVQNNGKDKLFNELLLEISTSDKELYKGKLADFMLQRELMPSSAEKLSMTIYFPDHLGNDFQGLDAPFSFVFTAEEKGNGVMEIQNMVGSDGGWQSGGLSLPNTATKAFTFLLIGCLLLAYGSILFTYNRLKNNNLDKTIW